MINAEQNILMIEISLLRAHGEIAKSGENFCILYCIIERFIVLQNRSRYDILCRQSFVSLHNIIRYNYPKITRGPRGRNQKLGIA
jgi:hypothetical protein